MTARPRKVETIVIGRGLAGAALAEALVQRGKRVALLVEEPGWEQGVRPASQVWHTGEERTALAEAGVARLRAWQAEGLPGIEQQDDGWLLDYDKLLPALGKRVAAGERCWMVVGTRVRGISVIENAVLGVIAEDARYDARQVINAAEDERYANLARMMRQRDALDLRPTSLDTPPASFPRDHSDLALGETAVAGAWRVRGVAGWPLLALGAAARLAEALDA